MSLEFDAKGFSPQFSVEIDPELPGDGVWSVSELAFKSDGSVVTDSPWGPRIVLLVEPTNCEAWLGAFESGGAGGMSGVFDGSW
jgi:hypothetical protein